jgi:heme exporter protein C
MKRLQIWLVWLTLPLVAADLYLVLIWSPQEKMMGNLIRIMYFHVASVWVAYMAFAVTLVAGLLYLVRPNIKLDELAGSSAEIGVLYTTVTLITGSIWAKPVWNTWWTWDPRLTTTLLLWLLYILYLLLRGLFTNVTYRARATSIVSILAFADIPVIHFAVEWRKSIHPQVIDESGVFMPSTMIFTLIFTCVTFSILYLVLLFLRYEQAELRAKIDAFSSLTEPSPRK